MAGQGKARERNLATLKYLISRLRLRLRGSKERRSLGRLKVRRSHAYLNKHKPLNKKFLNLELRVNVFLILFETYLNLLNLKFNK